LIIEELIIVIEMRTKLSSNFDRAIPDLISSVSFLLTSYIDFLSISNPFKSRVITYS